MGPGNTRRSIEQGGFILFLALATLGLVYIAWPFIRPIIWATLAAIMFQPLYLRLLSQRPGKINQAAVASLLIIFFAVLLPGIWIASIVIEEAAGIFVAFQEGRIDVAAWVEQILAALPRRIRQSIESSGWTNLQMLQDRLQQLATESAGLIARQAVAIGGGALSWALAFGVGLYVTFFLLRDGQAVGQSIVRTLPLERSIAQDLAERFVAIVRATVKGSVVVGMVQGALGGLTFWIVGMPSAVLFGVLMAIFSLLPAVGPAIVWVPAAIWLLATGAVWEGVVVIISGVALVGMIDNILRPILVGRDTGIPDWIILITTLGGIATIGLSGIVLGPLVAGLFLAGWATLRRQREQLEDVPEGPR